MAKKKSLFECQHCGFQTPKWMGKCSNCGAWESLVELNSSQIESLKHTNMQSSAKAQAISIVDIKEDDVTRFSSYDSEFDLVLGGGIVPGSLVLIGGSPGIGKSTLLLKVAGNLAKHNKKVLYVSGEESLGQIKIRANRLEANEKDLFLLPEIKLELILQEFGSKGYELMIIDSIQTIYQEEVSSAPGSVSQVRAITFELMRIAKEKMIPIFIIGHITKDGSIAGPRVLEHMVDTVLYFDGDATKDIRLLRGFKNRFGNTSEIGIFEMTKNGLESTKNFKFFSNSKNQSGSALTVVMEGSRPITIEVQALVSDAYGNPKRSSNGFDSNRLTMLLALLEKKLDLPFNQYDVFINIAGGIKVSETAADLAIVAAILSSFRNRALSRDSLFIGEVSLTGDIRSVSSLEVRLNEAVAQGFSNAIVPSKCDSKLKLFVVEEVEKVIDWM
ncbi:MAG: DNA repair protein RadA [Campylobacterota bacterium]